MAAQDSLKVSAILGRTASGASTGVPDVDQEELRLAATALLRPGYLPSMIDQTANASAFNVRQDTGSNLQLKIGSGTTKKDGYVVLGTAAGQGAYIVRLDATTKTITVPAADATNPARYGVYLYIDDAAYSGTASRAYANVACIRGTPAGSPTTPGPLATYSAYALLWEFQLAANATAVTNTILDNTTISTDRRIPSSRTPTALDGVIVTLSSPLAAQTSGTLHAMNFDTRTYDPYGFAAAGTIATVTIPTGYGGLYIVNSQLVWSSTPVTQRLALNHNSAFKETPVGAAISATSATWLSSVIVRFAAGDTVGINAAQTSGSTLTVTPTMELRRIGL